MRRCRRFVPEKMVKHILVERMGPPYLPKRFQLFPPDLHKSGTEKTMSLREQFPEMLNSATFPLFKASIAKQLKLFHYWEDATENLYWRVNIFTYVWWSTYPSDRMNTHRHNFLRINFHMICCEMVSIKRINVTAAFCNHTSCVHGYVLQLQ